jgi:choline dehydrogenase-like flavoprotein
MLGKSQGPMYRSEKPRETSIVPSWILDLVATHGVDFWLTTEDLPLPQNRVTLERDGRIKLDYTPTNEVPKRMLYAHLKSMLDAIGMHPGHLLPRNLYLQTDVGLAAVAHQAGTARFGRDPQTSVLDTTCKAHELDNLYIVDTSFMPSIGAVNPGLTAMANALRVADHLFDRLGVDSRERVASDPGTAIGLSERVTHAAAGAPR